MSLSSSIIYYCHHYHHHSHCQHLCHYYYHHCQSFYHQLLHLTPLILILLGTHFSWWKPTGSSFVNFAPLVSLKMKSRQSSAEVTRIGGVPPPLLPPLGSVSLVVLICRILHSWGRSTWMRVRRFSNVFGARWSRNTFTVPSSRPMTTRSSSLVTCKQGTGMSGLLDVPNRVANKVWPLVCSVYLFAGLSRSISIV